jgi:hypothetical protein
MLWQYSMGLLIAGALLGAGGVDWTASTGRDDDTVLHLSSSLPGREVRFQGVILVVGQPMRVVQGTTPFQWHADRPLVFAAFEPTIPDSLLRLTLESDTPEPAVVTGPRVLVGRRIGGVATEFVQPY